MFFTFDVCGTPFLFIPCYTFESYFSLVHPIGDLHVILFLFLPMHLADAELSIVVAQAVGGCKSCLLFLSEI